MMKSLQPIDFMVMAEKKRMDSANKVGGWRVNKPTVIPLIGFDEKLQRREELIQMINYLDSEKKQIEQELKDYLGENSAAENNHFRILWKEVYSNRVDTTKLKKEEPIIYEKYLKGTTSKRFVVQAI